MANNAYLGYLAEEVMSAAFTGGASGTARDLVSDRERQEGVFEAS
jgi:hypothetical protein